MAIVEDEALVLRSLRYGDTSRITTLLGRRLGKIHVIAKGARASKSPFGAALEILTMADVLFYQKKTRTLHLLKAAAVKQAYTAIVTSPTAYHIASAALEFVQKVLVDEDPCPGVFNALRCFLEGCERAPESQDERGEVRLKAFQLQTVSFLGYAPQLDLCARCGGAAEPHGGFGVAEGGLLCRKCASGARLLPLSRESLSLLRAIVGRGRAGAATGAAAAPGGAGQEGAASEATRAAAHGTAAGRSAPDRELAVVVESFLRYHVTGYGGLRSLRSLSEWRELTAGMRPSA